MMTGKNLLEKARKELDKIQQELDRIAQKHEEKAKEKEEAGPLAEIFAAPKNMNEAPHLPGMG
jgi:hypothetical protein